MRNGDFTDDAFGNPTYLAALVESNYVTREPAPDPTSSAIARAIRYPLPPTAARRPGTIATRFRQGLINPIAQEMINLYPAPNANNPALGYNYVNEPVRKLNERKFDVRLDHNFSTQGFVHRALQLRSGRLLRSRRRARASPKPMPSPATKESSTTDATRPSRKRTFFLRTP